MRIFETVSPDNTNAAIDIAIAKARKLSADIVVSTTSGASAVLCAEKKAAAGCNGTLIAVSHVWGMKAAGENSLTGDNRKKLTDAGVIIVTAAHALSGVERAISGKFGGAYPVEIMAHTLRMFSQGVKVCVEIGAMALDAGAITEPQPVIALGGTGRGLDTVCLLTPGYSARIFETRIHEILCKPY